MFFPIGLICFTDTSCYFESCTQTQHIKRMIMNKTTLLLASVALTLSGVAQADKLEDIQKSGRLRVGTTGDYKPFSYYDGKANRDNKGDITIPFFIGLIRWERLHHALFCGLCFLNALFNQRFGFLAANGWHYFVHHLIHCRFRRRLHQTSVRISNVFFGFN